MPLINRIRLDVLRASYPQVSLGEGDAKIGEWREVVGHGESFAYEIGRMLALDPPKQSGLGITVSPEILRALIELGF